MHRPGQPEFAGLPGTPFAMIDTTRLEAELLPVMIQMIRPNVLRSTQGEEYEEVVAFHPEPNPSCPLIMWRTAKLVFVQPLIGGRQRYGSVAKALDSRVMATMPCTLLTDITTPAIY